MLDIFRKIAEQRFELMKEEVLPEIPREKVPFTAALKNNAPRALILEYKRASPSHGPFEGLPPLNQVVSSYENQGATALSILTEEKKFLGNLEDLRQASSITSLPLLRKDFIVYPGEVEIASAYGADAILVIVGMLSDQEIRDLLKITEDCQMDALVEVHNEEELERALKFPIELLGINNRNLKTLKTDTLNYLELLKKIPEEINVLAASGYDSLEDIAQLPDRTIAVLAGTSFLLELCE